MASVRALAACVGIGGNISILRNFFGFFRGVLPPDPTGAGVTVSLRRQLGLLQGEHFNVNVIAVGVDNFVDADDIEVDYAIFKMRNVYNQVGTGVGRVAHYAITVAQANGLDAPTTRDQLEELTENWTIDNDGIDLFVVHDMNIPSNGGIILGRSAVGGPCPDNKDAKGMSGSTAGLWGSEQTARTIAHELGHYLTLGHRNSQTSNLMCQSGSASSIRNSVQLTSGQGDDVQDHCMSRDDC